MTEVHFGSDTLVAVIQLFTLSIWPNALPLGPSLDDVDIQWPIEYSSLGNHMDNSHIIGRLQ